jgi:hypothetical protein
MVSFSFTRFTRRQPRSASAPQPLSGPTTDPRSAQDNMTSPPTSDPSDTPDRGARYCALNSAPGVYHSLAASRSQRAEIARTTAALREADHAIRRIERAANFPGRIPG